ncbi:hypothetical protein M8818_000137 [Zalaria obscura]|uniref:Uncharacterized protein n=1 Tax=Zalaria obscura TaxID=2024903 RepID=A0ACC3SS08_9PEZI
MPLVQSEHAARVDPAPPEVLHCLGWSDKLVSLPILSGYSTFSGQWWEHEQLPTPHHHTSLRCARRVPLADVSDSSAPIPQHDIGEVLREAAHIRSSFANAPQSHPPCIATGQGPITSLVNIIVLDTLTRSRLCII